MSYRADQETQLGHHASVRGIAVRRANLASVATKPKAATYRRSANSATLYSSRNACLTKFKCSGQCQYSCRHLLKAHHGLPTYFSPSGSEISVERLHVRLCHSVRLLISAKISTIDELEGFE